MKMIYDNHELSDPEGTKKTTVTSIKKQLNKIEGWSRDGSAKKYTNKICRDNVSHPLYIPMLAFWVAVHTHNIYGTHTCRNGKSILYTHGSISKYSDTLHTESEVYDINCREKQARDV